MKANERITLAALTLAPNIAQETIVTRMIMVIISVHPARISVRPSLRFTTVTVMKTKKPNTVSISSAAVMYGLIEFRRETGLTSPGADQAQNAIARIRKTTARITETIVDRTTSRRSGTSSLTAVLTDLGGGERPYLT